MPGVKGSGWRGGLREGLRGVLKSLAAVVLA